MVEVEIKDKGGVNISLSENKGACIAIVGKYISRSYKIEEPEGGGGTIPVDLDIITKDSDTIPTDENVYSALRSNEEFVSAKHDDTVNGNITFKKNVVVEGGQIVKGLQTLHKGFQTAVFRNVAGQITGAQLTEDGILTVAGLQAMTFEVFELIYNLIKAQSGKVTYSPTVTIESCMYAMDENETELVTPDDFYNNNKGAIGSVWNNAVGSIHHIILTIKKTDDNKGLIPLVNGDFIYGYVNQIGESGQYSRGGQSIMHVITPDTEIGEGGSMVIRAMLEPIGNAAANPNYVSSNMPPTESMVLAQRGNINGAEGRTTSFFIDTEAGHIIMLQNVTTPTITDANYAIINGLLPDDLLAKVRAQYPIVDKHTPVSYARYGIFENILEFAHQGGFIQRENPRGAWDINVAMHTDPTKRYKNKVNYYDTVTHDGSTWKCLLSDQPDEPGTNNAVWLQLVAKGDDGTSIKIKGEKPSVNELPTPPADISDCYIVGQDLYVWLPDTNAWHNVGQFKGDKGDRAYVHIAYANSADGVKDFSTTEASGRTYIGTYSDNIKKDSETPSDYTWMYNKGDKGDKGDDTVTLDLSNDMDSMMYSADDTKLTTDVNTTASLRVGKTVNPSGIVWLDPITNGCTATRTGNTYTVTAINEGINDASVTIKANYDGETYERIFTVKKIVGQAKYEVLCTPNSLTYNKTTSVISSAFVNVYIYKTEQGGSGTLERNIVESLPDRYTLKVNGAVVSYSAGSHKITTSSTVSEYIVELFDNNNALLDSETVSLTKVKDGVGIADEIIEYGVSDDFDTEPNWSESEPDKIEQGKVLWVKTTTIYTNELPPNVTITKTYQGRDNTSVQYELRTNVNIIYIHDRESASKQSIRIAVGKTTSKGYTEITDSDTLREEGFIVQYNYDSRGERKTLSFADTAMLLEGNDDTLLVGEDDSEMVYEFTVEDITSIEDHIMFYLAEVDSAGNVIQDWATREVDVVRDGDGALTIDLNEDSIVLTTSVDTEPYTIINDGKTYMLYPKVKIGGVEQTLSELIDAGKVSVKDSNDDTYTFRRKESVSFNPNQDIYKENGVIVESLVPTWIDFTVNTTNSKEEIITATKRINIIRNYRGLTGKTGALYFAQGFYSEQAAKAHLYICNEQNVGFVLDAEVKDSQDGGHYEYTGKPFRYIDDKGVIYTEDALTEEQKEIFTMLTPHEDYALGGDYAWKYMPKYEVVLANFIMANNARFGHLTRGGVFYDRYLFSAYGTSKEGGNVTYDSYVEDMFIGNDESGYVFDGDFTPNLFLDFFGGAAKFGKLSESFIHIDNGTILKTINLDECHNISCAPLLSSTDGSVVVVMPKATTNKWTTDGTHSTIIHEYSAEFASFPYITDRYEAVLCVCADDALLGNASPNYNEIFGMGEDTDDNEAPHNGWFIWNGYRTKFIFLTPSSILKLRSCNTDGGGLVWFVENSSDFEILDARIALKYGGSETEVFSDQTITLQGSYRNPVLIGSKALNQLKDGSGRKYPSWDWNPTLSEEKNRYLTPKYDK